MRSVGRWLGRLARLGALAGMVAGVPYGLVTQVGWLLPRRLPTGIEEVQGWLTTPVTDELVIGLVAAALWILWGSFCASTLVEIIYAVRGMTVPRLPALAPMQNLAAWLLSGLTAGMLATTGIPTAAAAPAPDPAPVVRVEDSTPAGAMAASLPGNAVVHSAHPTSGAAGGDDQLIHEVARGDWMWHIAGRYLGDETRYPEIAALNPELAQRHPGFPDHIQPGDRLRLPDDAIDHGTRHHATGDTIVVQPDPPAARTPEPPIAPPTEAAPPPAAPPPAEAAPPPAVPPRTPAELEAPTPPTADGEPSTGNDTVGENSASDEQEAEPHNPADEPVGITLPSGAWISIGLAGLIATVAIVLRLHQRRRHRLRTRPIPTKPGAAASPTPASLADAEAAGARTFDFDADTTELPGVLPGPPAVRAPVAVTERGAQIGLFDLPGPLVGLTGPGATAAVRAVLAAALATGVSEHMGVQPRVIVPYDLLASLLPDGAEVVGLDPYGEAFDGDRLIITADAASAVAHVEQEVLHRWRILDQTDAESVAELCARDEQPEHLPPLLLVVTATGRQLSRVRAIASHRQALDLHTVVIGPLGGATNYQVEPDGTLRHADGPAVGRLSTLTASDLADLLQMIRQAVPRAEAGAEPEDPLPAEADVPAAVPAPVGGQPPVRLRVLGPVTLETDAGPVTGIRTGSLAILALLAAHPEGRGMDEIVLTLDPAIENRPAARNRVRTDISALRAALREATGLDQQARFITYHERARRYAIDADLIDVDLWQVLTAIQTANKTGEDQEAVAALRQATSCYTGEFAADLEQAWTIGYATTVRNQIISAWARIAEITEADQPDEAIAALEQAIDIDPVNEELYQRLMRIHGRCGNPDAVRATLRLLESRLAELGDTEPSQATQRTAFRQLSIPPLRPQPC